MSSIETYMDGVCPCRVKLSDGTTKVVNTLIRVPCIYTSDWQVDGGFMHDEGWADWDMADAEVVYPDEFSMVIDGEEVESNGSVKITELLEVISESNLVINL